MIPLPRIRAASLRAAPHVLRTPIRPVDGGALLKLECLQHGGSFKARGFFAAALALPKERLQDGLLTVSAGNAALAAAYVAHRLGVSCRVMMYETAPKPKIDGVRRFGATPILLPRERLLEWVAARGWEGEKETFIHPFADEEVIAGHGGLGLELLEDVPDLERVVVPVGGGGLLCGVANALEGVKPGIEVIGVQSDGYPLWPRVFEAGGPVPLTPATIADGTTAPFDATMFERLREVVDRWVVVPEAGLRGAIRELAMGVKVVAEGAGALAYAALAQLPEGARTVAIVSGGNVAPELLAEALGGGRNGA
jgi:threonine dehydratase